MNNEGSALVIQFKKIAALCCPIRKFKSIPVLIFSHTSQELGINNTGYTKERSLYSKDLLLN